MSSADQRHRPPTLRDVAARTNVSRQTISRVINNKGEVSDTTRKRVLEAIQELGYHPNTLARSLVTNKTLVIGLSVPNIDQPFFPQIARGVEDAATENGYSVFLCNAAGDQERELKAIERLRGHRVAGFISVNSRLSDGLLEGVVGGAFPVVMINRELPTLRGTVIWPGYRSGGYLATSHLINQGRRRIVYLGLPYDSNVDTDKQNGYWAALSEAKIPFDADRVVKTVGQRGNGFNELFQVGYNAMERIMQDGLDFDSIFASNDLPAIGAMRYLTTHGIDVPGDIAIVGFGASNVSGLVTPSLSTVIMPLHEMGVTAFHTLLDLINGESHEQRIVQASPELIVRESSRIVGVSENPLHKAK